MARKTEMPSEVDILLELYEQDPSINYLYLCKKNTDNRPVLVSALVAAGSILNYKNIVNAINKHFDNIITNIRQVSLDFIELFGKNIHLMIIYYDSRSISIMSDRSDEKNVKITNISDMLKYVDNFLLKEGFISELRCADIAPI
jgi:hypothetical protein